jgi:hypothetical protein
MHDHIARGNVSLARDIPFCANFFLSAQRVYTVKKVCVCLMYTHTHDLTAWGLYMNYFCYQIILRVKHF